jgi:hypothetical protein
MPGRMHRHHQETLDGDPHRHPSRSTVLRISSGTNRKRRGGLLPIFDRIPLWLRMEDERTALFATILYEIDRDFFQFICSLVTLETTVIGKDLVAVALEIGGE